MASVGMKNRSISFQQLPYIATPSTDPTPSMIRFMTIIMSESSTISRDAGMPTLRMSIMRALSKLKPLNVGWTYVSFFR